jgi:hypothetical protein
MALLSHGDYQTLSSWNFLTDYQNYQPDIINIARGVYSAIEMLFSSRPHPSDCEDALTAALLSTKPFTEILQKKPHARPSLYQTFARQMARFVLDNEWKEITKP